MRARALQARRLRKEDSRKAAEPKARTVDRQGVQRTEKVLATGQVSLRPSALQERRLRQNAEPLARKDLAEVSPLSRRGDAKAVRRLGKGTVNCEQEKSLARRARERPLVHLTELWRLDSERSWYPRRRQENARKSTNPPTSS